VCVCVCLGGNAGDKHWLASACCVSRKMRVRNQKGKCAQVQVSQGEENPALLKKTKSHFRSGRAAPSSGTPPGHQQAIEFHFLELPGAGVLRKRENLHRAAPPPKQTPTTPYPPTPTSYGEVRRLASVGCPVVVVEWCSMVARRCVGKGSTKR
jgi:hypothetical protein